MSDGHAAGAAHPELWALSQLTAAAGGPIDDAFAVGVCGGAGLLGLAFRDTRAQRSTLHLTGWNPFQSNLLAGLERLGLPATVRETMGRRRAARNLERALEESAVAVLWVDGATVGLAPAELAGMSPTVVVARTTSQGVELSDGPQHAVVVDADQLSEARRANRAHRTRVVTLAPGSAAADLAVVYRRGLAATAVGPVGGPPDASGADGLTELANGLAADGEGSWTDTFPGGWELTRSLVALRTSVLREDGLLRRLQAAFTADAARATGIAELTPVAADYAGLAAAWLDVADVALPADVPALAALRPLTSEWELSKAAGDEPFPLSAGETTELLHGLAARLSALADQEREALEHLRRVLRTA